MFTQTFEYALRCVLFLARQGDAVVPIRHIAAETEIPRDYLYKLVPMLNRGGLVSASRGKLGGLRLKRAADSITVFDVLLAVEHWNRLTKCPLTDRRRCVRTDTDGRLCGLHSLLDQVVDSVERRLTAITLADFLREGTVSFYSPLPNLAGSMARRRPRPAPARARRARR